MKLRNHYILLGLSLALTLSCGFLVPRVKVNTDMTKYLPDQSTMKHGLDILNNEFDVSQLQQASVRVMMDFTTERDRREKEAELLALPAVRNISSQLSPDSTKVLYSLSVAESVDQKAMGHDICDTYGEGTIVETGQDGATPPLSVIVIAAVLILLVLLIMGQSWLDPIVLLLPTGLAVLINIGTNALLPSVSITTNYIGAILQLVLSLDYCIVLTNRYRQERARGMKKEFSINRAIRRASASILSSALTTIVGLMVLGLMRLKIGLDLGIVLAKGVVCSLFCTFTVLPSLLVLLDEALSKTHKPTKVIPTDGLGRFATNHKIPLALVTLVLFGVSFWASRKTEISFSTNGESQIDKVFAKTNPFLIIYSTEDEDVIIPMADSLLRIPHIQSVYSYPTLFRQEFTAEQMLGLSSELTPEMLNMVYYTHSGRADTLHLEFAPLMHYLIDSLATSPMASSFVDSSMVEQMNMLKMMLDAPAMVEDKTDVQMSARRAPATPIEAPELAPEPVQVSTAPATPISEPAPTVEKAAPVAKAQPKNLNEIPIIPFMTKLYNYEPEDEIYYLVTITDTTQIRRQMNVKQMAAFIGSTNFQTKMVFSFSKGGETMSPLQYVHFLTADLFNRPSLKNMVSEEQKLGLQTREAMMLCANKNGKIAADKLAKLLTNYGVQNMSGQKVKEIMWGKKLIAEVEHPQTEAAPAEESAAADNAAAATQTPAAQTAENSLAVEDMPAPVKPKRKVHRKTQEEIVAETMDQLVHGGKAYTATEMAAMMQKMGQKDVTEDMMRLLFAFYGSTHYYDNNLKMSPEQMLNYVADTLTQIPVVAQMMAKYNMSTTIDSARVQVSAAANMLRKPNRSVMAILTDLKDESAETYAFVDHLRSLADSRLEHEHYMIGESVMFSEMKQGFNHEMTVVTIWTVIAIFLIVALTFRSVVIPAILVLTVMTAVYINVVFSGIWAGNMLYLAYLIVQSILMGATIDYGILMASSYREHRKKLLPRDAVTEAYHTSIRTIMTSGLIMVLAPGVMAVLVQDVAIRAIVGCLSIGALAAILLILLVVPAVLVAFDRWVVSKKALKVN